MTGRDLLASRKGFALVNAIFVIVVLAFLGTIMVVMSGVQSSTPVFALQGARAYHAARSGLEWGISRALAGNCAANSTFNMPAGGLAGFTVTVGCSSTVHREGPTLYNVYRITSLAQGGTYGSPGYASRQVTGWITDAP